MQKAAFIADNTATGKPEPALSGHNERETSCWLWQGEPAPSLNRFSRLEERIEGHCGGVRKRIDPPAISGAEIDHDESLSLGHATSAAREAEADRDRHGALRGLAQHGVGGNAPIVGTLICIEG